MATEAVRSDDAVDADAGTGPEAGVSAGADATNEGEGEEGKRAESEEEKVEIGSEELLIDMRSDWRSPSRYRCDDAASKKEFDG